MTFKVIRVMNNNAILAKNLNEDIEVVLMGKGIGFERKRFQVIKIDSNTIEKSFVAGNSLKKSYIQMLQEGNSDIVELCTEIFLTAEKRLGELSERSFIVIVDHISFALEKLKKNIKIDNPFSFEIAQLYPEEYAIGEYARERILDVLDVDITEAEVGFIALHLNAAKQHIVVTDALKNTRLIKTMIKIVEYELNISLKDCPRLNNRFLLHLRGLIQKINEGRVEEKHSLFDITVSECKEAFLIARKLGDFLSKEKKRQILDTEIFYLTLHIDRLIRNSRYM